MLRTSIDIAPYLFIVCLDYVLKTSDIAPYLFIVCLDYVLKTSDIAPYLFIVCLDYVLKTSDIAPYLFIVCLDYVLKTSDIAPYLFIICLDYVLRTSTDIAPYLFIICLDYVLRTSTDIAPYLFIICLDYVLRTSTDIAPYLFIICLDYVLRTFIDKMKENGFKLTKERSRRYPVQTITDADYADDIAPAQAETLLHSLERAAVGICLFANAHKTEYMSFNQTGDISTLNGNSLKLKDKFTYLRRSVSSTETDINTRLANAWTANHRLSVIWKSDLTAKIKCSFSQAALVSILLYGCSIWTLTKRMEKKPWRQLHRNAASNIKQVVESAPQKAAGVRPPTTQHEN